MTALRQRQPYHVDEVHSRFVRTLPCVVCGDHTGTEAAHVSYPDPRFDKRSRGQRERTGPWVVPLCNRHHHESHTPHGMPVYAPGTTWEHYCWFVNWSIDPHTVAAALLLYSGDAERCERILEWWRNRNVRPEKEN